MAAESHNQHKSVVPVSFRNWKGVHTHQLYLWKGDFKQRAVHGLDKESFVEEMKMLLSFHRIDPAFGMQMFLIRHSSSRQSLCFDKPFQANAFTRVVPFCWVCGALLSEYVSSDRESEEQRFHAITGNQQMKQDSWVCESIVFVRCRKCEQMRRADFVHIHPLPYYLAIDGIPSLLLSSMHRTQWCPLCSHLLTYFNQQKQSAPRSPVFDDATKRVLELRNYMSKKVCVHLSLCCSWKRSKSEKKQANLCDVHFVLTCL